MSRSKLLNFLMSVFTIFNNIFIYYFWTVQNPYIWFWELILIWSLEATCKVSSIGRMPHSEKQPFSRFHFFRDIKKDYYKSLIFICNYIWYINKKILYSICVYSVQWENNHESDEKFIWRRFPPNEHLESPERVIYKYGTE